ncbi:hypothetical protein CLOHAE12215_01358 [Clostridium haemolyticum]|uniref:BRO-N domain-containing protein n=1 Tax=Clostridium haemolyticum TaxID=84025 RepID=UPI001C3A46C0|nr:BRO family protein [Clostridium haemolyticum]CAG7839942.1 hypothetical protein CLOHAE12215_01358 [Clostridium haemolyticum]
MGKELEIVKQFEGNKVEMIEKDGRVLFELYSTGMALGYVKTNTINGKTYVQCRKERVSNTIKNAEIKPLVQGGLKYLNEEMLYDFMLEAKTEKCKSFRKWVTSEVLPTIRKTGGYVANADLMVNTYFGALDDTHKTIVKSLFENIENQQKQIIQLKDDNEILDKENDLLSGENLKWADRSLINALVRAYGSKLGNFGEAWTKFKKEILYKHSININARITNFMNSTGKKTKPRTLKMLHDEELSNAVSTIVALCRDNDVDISDIIKKYENELNRKELVD